LSQKPVKSSMSPEERANRRAAVGKAATEKIAKSEQLNFRLEEPSIKELQEMAFTKGLPVGTMIRDWVLERLAKEKAGSPDVAGKALHVLDEIHTKLNFLFEHDATLAAAVAKEQANPSEPTKSGGSGKSAESGKARKTGRSAEQKSAR